MRKKADGGGGLLLRALLLLYPAEFRKEHGREWLEAARDRSRRIRSAHRHLPTVAFVAFVLKDTLKALPNAWRRSPRKGRGSRRAPFHHPSNRQHRPIMEPILSDLRFAVRTLRKSPGFTAVAVLTLALGIGANTAVFAVVDGVLLEPLPYPDPEGLTMIWQTDDQDGDLEMPWSVPDLLDVKGATEGLDGLAGYAWLDETLTGLGEPELVYAVGVTTGLLEAFDTPPALGRDIRPEEALEGGPRVAVISHAFWTERLGGDPEVLGRTLELSGIELPP